MITGFFFAAYYKAPDYKKDIQYNWEKPDFNPDDDLFMRHFDENGNFVNTAETESGVDEATTDVSQTLSYQYVFKPTVEDKKTQSPK